MQLDENENLISIYSYIDEAAEWMLKQQNPSKLVPAIASICEQLTPINRQLTKPEIALLERIARTEELLKSHNVELKIGVEQEISFVKSGQRGIAASTYDILGDEIAQGCAIAGSREKRGYGTLFNFGREPGLSGIYSEPNFPFGREPNLREGLDLSQEQSIDEPPEDDAPGEFRTVKLTPLQAIMVTRLAELAICGQLRFGSHVNEDYNYARLNNHIHFSLISVNPQTRKSSNLSAIVINQVLKAAIDGLVLLISPEEREEKEVKIGVTPFRLAIATHVGIENPDRSCIIARARHGDVAHYELRKTASGEPKTVNAKGQVIGLDPLITSMAVLCAGVEHNIQNLGTPSRSEMKEKMIELIFAPKNKFRNSGNTCYLGYIPEHVFVRWFEKMQKSPLLNHYFGKELMEQLVDALVEQDPALANSVFEARGR